MSNLTTITTNPRLLATFAKSLDSLGLAGVSLQWDPAQKRLLAKGAQGKATLEVRPALYPSRALIDWIPATERAGVLVVCPHIAAALAADLRRAGLNHADLNGRFFLQTPWLLVDREPKQRVHRNPLAEPDIFSGKSSRLARLLLRRTERGWTQAELAERTGLSLGLVSRLLATLERQALVSREGGGKRKPQLFRLRNFDGLLDSWREKDDWKKRVVIQEFSVLGRNEFEIAKQVTAGLPAADIAFTQWFAAWLRQPYATVPVVSAYVRHEELIHTFKARAVATGGNLWLIAPQDEEVLFDTQEVQGYRLVSDVQIYLDLLQVGQRGPDAAEALRQWEGFAR